MRQLKRVHPKEKISLHLRNKHRERYDFKLLMESFPALSPFVKVNPYGDESIDFFNPIAVRMLNTALLKKYYSIDNWSIPSGYLCPPIPGRADYIHTVADLLSESNNGHVPIGDHIKCLDIGVGASCIYPIVGSAEYHWSFTGVDIDTEALESAQRIIASNALLENRVKLRLQPDSCNIFKGVIAPDEFFDLTICNPPFHASAAEAHSGTQRKLRNLGSEKSGGPILNFGGQQHELWCDGGEARFIRDMVIQSKDFAHRCLWFSTLISKESNLKSISKVIEISGASFIRTIPMGQGNKKSRVVAWTFLSKSAQQEWVDFRWNKTK
jgi:23S rRNA (adenine1618-N6)-methyltransferase